MIDSSLNQIKKRLINQGILIVVKDHNGHRSYALTDQGRGDRSKDLRLAAALDDCRTADDNAADPALLQGPALGQLRQEVELSALENWSIQAEVS
jgi:hypothetical protein